MYDSTAPPGPASTGQPKSPSTHAARRRLLRVLRRTVARHRRLLAAGLLALAATAAVVAARPPALPLVPVAVAAHDLAPGRPLGAEDVSTATVAAALVPAGAYLPGEVPLRRLVAGPVPAGAPLTDLDLVGPGLASGLARGEVLTVVRVRDPAADLVRPGDVVRVLGTDPRGGAGADVLAAEATIVTVPEDMPEEQTAGTDGASAVVVAVPEPEALALSGAATTQVLDILVPALRAG